MRRFIVDACLIVSDKQDRRTQRDRRGREDALNETTVASFTWRKHKCDQVGGLPCAVKLALLVTMVCVRTIHLTWLLNQESAKINPCIDPGHMVPMHF